MAAQEVVDTDPHSVLRNDGITNADLERILLRWGYITSPLNPEVQVEFERQRLERVQPAGARF